MIHIRKALPYKHDVTRDKALLHYHIIIQETMTYKHNNLQETKLYLTNMMLQETKPYRTSTMKEQTMFMILQVRVLLFVVFDIESSDDS